MKTKILFIHVFLMMAYSHAFAENAWSPSKNGGAAATATALAANPTDCGSNQFAISIDAMANLTCSAVTSAFITDGTIVGADLANGAVDLAGTKVTGSPATATALAANPTDCTPGQFATAIIANGNLTCSALSTDLAISTTLTNAAGSSANPFDITSSLGIFNGSDTYEGIDINITNADHTGSGNVVTGIDISGITADAQATEKAINIGAGWDSGITLANNLDLTIGASTGNGTFTYNTADANSNHIDLTLPEGDSTNVPCIFVQDATLYKADSTFLNGQNDPCIAIASDDGTAIGYLYDTVSNLVLNTSNGGRVYTPTGIVSNVNFEMTGSGSETIMFASSGVFHPFTSIATSNIPFQLSKISPTSGGAKIEGFTDTDAVPMVIFGHIGSTNPTDSRPAIRLSGDKSDGGTGATALGSAETVLSVDNSGTSVLTLLGNGNAEFSGTVTSDSTLLGTAVDVGSGNLNAGTSTLLSLSINSGAAITKHLSALATNVTSASINAVSCGNYGTITVAGAAVGDTVYASPDADSSATGIEDSALMWNAVITSTNTVTIRACNPTALAVNPGDDQEWRADVWEH